MREIKFRAWDGVRKEMNHKVLVGNTCVSDDNYTAHWIHNGTDWVNFDEHDDITLLQFTGLTDKNGVEIYEGDIYFDRGVSRYGFIERKYCNFRVIQFDSETVGFNARTHCGTSFIDKGCVIEGNIYENPELLRAGE